jgi:hypothetical protein
MCAFVATFWQAYISRQHNKLSVKPHLIGFSDNSSGGAEFHLFIQNNGVGPALITSFQITIDGNKIEKSSVDETIKTIKNKLFPKFNCNLVCSESDESYMMAVNEKLTVFRFVFDANDRPTLNTIDDARNRIKVNVDYESIYKEKFSLSE